MKKFEYRADAYPGNFFELVSFLNHSNTYEGWELVSAQYQSSNICLFILKRGIE